MAKSFPYRAIQEARHTSRRAASMRVAMSARMKATAWLSPMRTAELLPLAGVVAGVFVGGAGAAHRHGSHGGAGGLEGLHGGLALGAAALAGTGQTLVQSLLAAEQAAAGHAHVVEDHLGGVRGADAVLAELLALGEAFGAGRDDEAGLAAGAEFGVDGGHDDVDVGDAAVGDPGLGAVEDPFVVGLVVDGAGADRADVAARVGFGDAEGAQLDVVGGAEHLRGPFQDLLLGAVGG